MGRSGSGSQGRALLCIADDPDVRLRDIAASVGITERSAYGIVSDLAAAGYAVKQKAGRRNRYQIQARLPLPEHAAAATTAESGPFREYFATGTEHVAGA
jgi:DNA-binding IclR family transcriptional regulator